MKTIVSTQIPIEDILQSCYHEELYPPSALIREIQEKGSITVLFWSKIIGNENICIYRDFGNELLLYEGK